MEIQQVRNIKRLGTWLAASLLILSVGLMLLGWTVPCKVAFDAGVFGFQLFPIAVLVVLIRGTIPFIEGTPLGKTLIGLAGPMIEFFSDNVIRFWNGIRSSVVNMNENVGYRWQHWQSSEDIDFIDASSPVKDAFRDPLRYGPLNTCPTHEDPISNPDGYIPDYEALFEDEVPGH